MASVVKPLDPADAAARPHRYFRRQYVWQWPIRIYHWVNAVCVTVLFSTGLYIASPILAPAGEPVQHFVMARFRQIHFVFAFLFLINFLWRIYWFWMGNNYARSGFPFFWRPQWWRDLFRQAFGYMRFHAGHIHLGHNALGGLAYTIFVIALGWAQIFTGLALYSESSPSGFWGGVVGWVIPLLGGSFQVRMWHHLFAWGFVFFAILHIYIILYDGLQYRNGLLTSMASGEKFFKDGDLEHDTWIS
ncbi:MAG: Ni/Fe-hydrogenase, b-type cytochrome subunit [Acidobacteria bacterium]|nr:Ni/Fe-hydrogenase, b-type cytochrome subunit [Acidobacteriota bacterium]